MTSAQFRKTVLTFYRKNGRHTLPWRKTRDPYKILVSEIMLQQTQVERVIPYFEKWMKEFPTVHTLAKAPLADVLKAWSGLGYNRRAKLLRECAKAIVEGGGKIPKDFAALVALPAIGPYTAGAIRAFAFDEKEVFIETNIRAALLHHFFPNSKKVDDKKLVPILQTILAEIGEKAPDARRGEGGARGVSSIRRGRHRGPATTQMDFFDDLRPREWYSALMDYGSHLKKQLPNPSRRSLHHTKQSQFTGSLRQARGAILRTLVSGPASEQKLRQKTPPRFFKKALEGLAKENMIEKKGSTWTIA